MEDIVAIIILSILCWINEKEKHKSFPLFLLHVHSSFNEGLFLTSAVFLLNEEL